MRPLMTMSIGIPLAAGYVLAGGAQIDLVAYLKSLRAEHGYMSPGMPGGGQMRGGHRHAEPQKTQ